MDIGCNFKNKFFPFESEKCNLTLTTRSEYTSVYLFGDDDQSQESQKQDDYGDILRIRKYHFANIKYYGDGFDLNPFIGNYLNVEIEFRTSSAEYFVGVM